LIKLSKLFWFAVYELSDFMVVIFLKYIATLLCCYNNGVNVLFPYSSSHILLNVQISNIVIYIMS